MDRFRYDFKAVSLHPSILQQIGACGLSGEEKNLTIRPSGANENGRFDPCHPRHDDIAYEHIRMKAVGRFNRGFSAVHSTGFKTRAIKDEHQCVRDHLFVIGNKDFHRRSIPVFGYLGV